VNTADIRALFGYDRWANFRLLDAASQLSTAEFTRDLGASFGSIRGTLVHIMWGERRWLQYWQEGTFAPPPNADDFPDAGAIAVAWSKLEAERQAFSDGLTDAKLATRVSVGDQAYTLGELIQHILDHSTYHRGQVASLIRQLGHTPPPTGYRFFLSESRR
jgi:uncharacterized damage-inducible protein DinB